MTTISLQQPELAEQLERLADEQRTTPEALLNAAVRAFLDNSTSKPTQAGNGETPRYPDFEREVAAFERLKPELLKTYKGRVVAIHQGQVVAVGDDRMAVLDTVLEKLGPVPCYIEWVEEETPRRVRMTSTWIAR
jgi:hypothetical protein